MSQIEVSPGGVGYIRTPDVSIPGVPESAKRQTWLVGGSSSVKSSSSGEVTIKTGHRSRFRKGH